MCLFPTPSFFFENASFQARRVYWCVLHPPQKGAPAAAAPHPKTSGKSFPGRGSPDPFVCGTPLRGGRGHTSILILPTYPIWWRISLRLLLSRWCTSKLFLMTWTHQSSKERRSRQTRTAPRPAPRRASAGTRAGRPRSARPQPAAVPGGAPAARPVAARVSCQ